MTFQLYFVWAFCSLGRINSTLTSINYGKFFLKWSANKRRTLSLPEQSQESHLSQVSPCKMRWVKGQRGLKNLDMREDGMQRSWSMVKR